MKVTELFLKMLLYTNYVLLNAGMYNIYIKQTHTHVKAYYFFYVYVCFERGFLNVCIVVQWVSP